MQRHGLAEDLRGTIAGIVVLERTDAGEHRPERAEPGGRPAGIFVIAPAYRQSDAMAGGYDDAGRPDLDVQLVDLAGLQRLLLVVRVVRAVRQRERRVELSL